MAREPEEVKQVVSNEEPTDAAGTSCSSFGSDEAACQETWVFPGCAFDPAVGTCRAVDVESPILTEAAPDGPRVSGSIELVVADAQSFAQDPMAVVAVRGSVAEFANVGYTRVQVSLEASARRLALRPRLRQLLGSTVTAAWTISLPEGRSIEEVMVQMENPSSAGEFAEICMKHVGARSLSYDVEVASVAVGEEDDPTLQWQVSQAGMRGHGSGGHMLLIVVLAAAIV